MTISSTTVKNSYAGNGTLDTFNYTFKIFANTDLQVIIRDATATETVKTLTTHYTVTGAGSASGGTIVFTAGNIPTATETVVIRRAVPQTQAIDYIANDPFPAESHEEGLDRAMMTLQQVQEELDRSIKLSRTNTMNSTEFTVGSTDRANKVLAFDSSGEIAVTQEIGTFRGNWSASVAYQQRDLIKDTTNNNIYIANTAHTSSGSLPITSNADSAKWNLIVDAAAATAAITTAAASATAAAASASAASTSESNASTSETNAAASASSASTSATNASNSATAAASSATAAANSAAAAEATFDNFDDSYLGPKASNPTLDNDGNALQDGALYFDTTNNVMKVYDLGTTTWYQLTPTVSNQTNINTVAGISSDVTTVAGISSNVTATANNNTNITTVAGQITPTNNVSTVAGVSSSISTLAPISSNITTVAGISSNVTTVAGISSDVSAVAGDATDIGTVATNLTGTNTIGTVAGSIANVNNVGGSIANVNTVAGNLSGVNYFGERYRVSATAPTTSLDVGDLYYDTSTDAMKVYGSSGWQNAGSSVNGTSQRYNYTATSGQTTFTGADNNGNTLTYDAGYIDVYLNGVKLLNGTDVTVTSGSSVVLASGATTGDVVDIVAYGTFSVASLNADNLDSGTIPDARITGTYTGITGLDILATGYNASAISTTVNDYAIKLAGATTSSYFSNGLIFSEGTLARSAIGSFDGGSSGRQGLWFATHDGTSMAERMRIDSSGNVFIGKTSSSETPGIELLQNGTIDLQASNSLLAYFNRTGSDGTLVEFHRSGVVKGLISSRSGFIDIGNDDAGLRFEGSNNAINPRNPTTGDNSDNSLDLGKSASRFKDLYLGGGLYVGGTGTANKLDDYEEGTWTPQYVNGPTINGAYGEYTKIGQIVHVIAKLYRDDATANSNTLELGNLPFAVAYDASNGIGHSGLGHASSYGGSTNRKHGMLDQSSGNVNLIKDGTLVYSTYDDFHSNQRFALYKWSYQTDA